MPDIIYFPLRFDGVTAEDRAGGVVPSLNRLAMIVPLESDAIGVGGGGGSGDDGDMIAGDDCMDFVRLAIISSHIVS